MSTNKYNIVPFDRNNWEAYKNKISLVLQKEGLWSIVDNTRQALPNNAFNEVRLKYQEQLANARATILLAMDDKHSLAFSHHTTAHALWNALVAQYEGGGVEVVVYLMRDLWRQDLEEDGDVDAHITKMERIFAQLAALHMPLPEPLQASALINTLPPSYDPLTTSIVSITSATNPLTFNKVKAALLHEVRKRKEGKVAAHTALMARKPRRPPRRHPGVPPPPPATPPAAPPAPPARSRYYCTHCKQDTHSNERCFILHPHLKKTRASIAIVPPSPPPTTPPAPALPSVPRKSWAFIATDTSKVSFANIDAKSHNWVVDSGANRHMVPHRDYFKTFVTFSTPHPVYLGDNRPTDALGIGNITLRAKVGLEVYEHVVKNVLYAPALHQNLFSLPTVLKLGYTVGMKGTSFTLSDEDIPVIQGSLRNDTDLIHLHATAERFSTSVAAKASTFSSTFTEL